MAVSFHAVVGVCTPVRLTLRQALAHALAQVTGNTLPFFNEAVLLIIANVFCPSDTVTRHRQVANEFI